MNSPSTPYLAFDEPVPPPSESDLGAVCFTFDDKWRPYILALFKTLMVERTWESDADRAIGEASQLVEQFISGGECVTPFAMPVGAVIECATIAVPAGWLLCDGSAVSRATYADLFAAIGALYGDGDFATTFNLPDMRDRFPRGANTALGANGGEATHTLTSAEAPAHTHTGPSHTHTGPSHSHDLGNHTHTGPSHTHTGPSHSHDLGNHTHAGPAHTHTGPSHTHTGPSHTHDVPLFQSGGGAAGAFGGGTAGSQGSRATTAAGTGATGASGTGATGSDGTGATGTPSTNATSTAGTGATGASGTGDSGTPSTNATSTAGTGATGAAGTGATGSSGSGDAHNNLPPYLALNFIIKT